MNAPLARFALRLLAQAPWRMGLLALAVAVTSAWLGMRSIVGHATIVHAEAETKGRPAIIAMVTDPATAGPCAAPGAAALGAIPGVRSASSLVECRRLGMELEVGRAEEVEAIAAEAAELLGDGWTVSTRARERAATLAALEQRAGRGLLSATPAVLSLLLLLLALGHGGAETRELVGKLKLVGFTTRQLGWLLGLRAVVPCLLGATGGVALAAGALGSSAPGWLRSVAGLGQAIPFSWSATFDAALAVGAFVLAPCLTAATLPAARLARSDPARLVEGG